MEQRRLRLGDIVDDYCPRERRVTNHAVVAMVEEDVKQTRCTTCDAEHAYKGGSAPRRRRKESPDSLYREVLAGIADPEGSPVLAAPAPSLHAPEEDSPAPVQSASSSSDNSAPEAGEELAAAPPAEDGPVHRQLIRATLPRLEGQKDARPNPEFTIRQSNGRPNGNFRGDNRGDQRGRPRGHGQHSNRPQGSSSGQRFQGSRPGNQSRATSGRGQGGGFRSAQGQQRRSGGGRKRSR